MESSPGGGNSCGGDILRIANVAGVNGALGTSDNKFPGSKSSTFETCGSPATSVLQFTSLAGQDTTLLYGADDDANTGTGFCIQVCRRGS